ncbi:MAG TPA: WD40 repeat domain-containing protein, partial [Pyrinomonadaceae bacterium]|nr:WD40 repeat domain-containing protein [Pyrinomonadaceae bacterium]
LKDALNKLSVPETRILRKSHGPDGSVWFELYHDIYGKILDTWRASFRARKHRLTILLGIVALVLLLILIPISWHWGLKPYNSRKTLMMAHLEKPEEYGRAVEAYESLSGTLGYGSIANSLMADAWERRARYAESRNQRDEATISWLKALSLKPDAPHGDLWRLKAGNLIGDDYQRVNHRWYHENRVTNAIFSDNAQLVATQTDDERIWIWDVESGTLIGKHADPQDSEPPEPVQADKTPPLRTPSSLRRQGPTNERAEPKSHIIQGVALNQELGWLVAITFNEGDTDQPDSGSRRRSPEDISPQPVLVLSNNDELVNSGIEAEKKRSSNFVDAELSSDGRFIATSGRGQKIRVWRIGEGKASPVEGFRSERFITNVTFSPDAKSLVMESETGRLSMWDVASGRLRYELPASGRKDELAFSSDSDSFAVSYYVNSNHLLVEVRNTETGEPLRTPVPIKKLGVWYGRLALGAENKVLVFTRNEDVWSVDPISAEVRQTVRVNARENPITSLGLSREVALTVLENEVRLHRVELETVRNPMLNPGENMGTSVLSEDGTRITTLIAKPKPDKSPYKPDKPQMHRLQVLDATTLAPIGDAIDNVLVLSDNGEYVATIDPEKPPDKRRRTKEKDDNELTIQILNVKNKSEVMKFQYPDVHGFTRLVSSASGKFFATYKLTRDTSYDSDFYRYLYYRGMMPSEESQDLEDGYIYVWDRDDPSRPMTSKIEITNAQQYTCAFSRDERFFAVSATSTTGIALWDLEKMQPLQLTKDLGRAGTLAFSERGQLIAGASNKLRTWDLTTRQPVNELDTLTRINAVALDSDSRTILTGDVSGNVSLWKFSPNGSASPVGEVRHRDPSNSVTFSVDKSVGIISAGKWLHTTNVSNHQYLQSYFLGSTWSGQCRSMSDSGAQFRCLFKLPNGELKIKDIKAGEIQDDVRLEGDAHALLETWSKRLGLFINNLGKIVPLESGAASVVTTGHTL